MPNLAQPGDRLQPSEALLDAPSISKCNGDAALTCNVIGTRYSWRGSFVLF